MKIKSIFFAFLFVAVFLSCKTAISDYESANTKIDSSFGYHSIDTIIIPYRNSLNKEMNEVIGYNDSAMISQAPESRLSNFIADAVFEVGFEYLKEKNINSDSTNVFSILNFGGIRSSLKRGEITLGNVYEIMPFDNGVSVLKISNEKINEMLQYLKEVNGQPISNIFIKYQDEKSDYNVGKSPTKHDFYYVVTSDYLAGGGDKMNFLLSPVERWDTGILIRDVLVNKIEKMKTIPFSKSEGRITFE